LTLSCKTKILYYLFAISAMFYFVISAIVKKQILGIFGKNFKYHASTNANEF